jgi:prespore-specific regulator
VRKQYKEAIELAKKQRMGKKKEASVTVEQERERKEETAENKLTWPDAIALHFYKFKDGLYSMISG